MKTQIDIRSKEDSMAVFESVLRDIVKCASDGASIVQLSVATQIDVKVEGTAESYEAEPADLCLTISNVNAISKNAARALGATAMAFIALCGSAGEFDYECKALE